MTCMDQYQIFSVLIIYSIFKQQFNFELWLDFVIKRINFVDMACCQYIFNFIFVTEKSKF